MRELAGKNFIPSNGTEGMSFQEEYCMNCIHCDPDPAGEKQCDLLLKSIAEWPVKLDEWVYDNEGVPKCTEWVKWDWGDNGNPDDPDNPNTPPKDDPSQLMMPFDIWELMGVSDEIVVTKRAIIERELLNQ